MRKIQEAKRFFALLSNANGANTKRLVPCKSVSRPLATT